MGLCNTPHTSIWQYYNQNDLYADILKYSNMGFTGMFSVETVLKIVAYGVKVSTQTLLHWQEKHKARKYINATNVLFLLLTNYFVYLHDCMGIFPAE